MSGLVLWANAVAALAFVLAGLAVMRHRNAGVPAAALVPALGLSAMWALAVAGIDPHDVATRIALSLRDIAWLAMLYLLVRRAGAGGWAISAVYVTVAGISAMCATIAVIETRAAPDALMSLVTTRLLFRMMSALGALFLLHRVRQAMAPASRSAMEPAAAALTLLWSTDLIAALFMYCGGGSALLDAARGASAIISAVLIAIAAGRDGKWDLSLSRRATLQTLSAAGLAVYLLLTSIGISLAAAAGGAHVRLIQTAIVAGTSVTLATLASTPWLRAWMRVKVAKHLFRHRYDYREAWQGFTATLAEAGADAAPLADRIARAMAGLIDAPAALTLVAVDRDLVARGGWRWPGEPGGDMRPLVERFAQGGRIVALDAARAGHGGEAAGVPDWLIDDRDAWAIAPLFHLDKLAGAVVLTAPPDGRAPDWEDFDVLRAAGRQAASYLAELGAADALAEARRFDEFHRRFAFIMHDLKNMVSQLSLVARNAERHADNPAFRTDMVATLNDSADRMSGLIARLSQHGPTSAEPLQPIDVMALAERIAARRRAQHPIMVTSTRPPRPAIAQPARLEQAIEHLVQNAIEASPPGMPVLLAVEETADGVAIDIVDRGCGMSADFVRDELFRAFTSNKPNGFGLGAHEARMLIAAMGGALSVDSDEARGTRFRVTLAAAATLEAAA